MQTNWELQFLRLLRKPRVFFIVSIVILPILTNAIESLAPLPPEANLTHWREHRRKKRFILFENAGICKLVCGITYPVDLSDKKPWRQLVMTMNLQYQFPVPPKPIYWWTRWQRRNLPNGIASGKTATQLIQQKDEAQEFLYEFVENYMERKGVNGRECLLKYICENAQIHRHQGVYAEILHRVLRPHRNLPPHYTEAWQVGKKGLNCRSTYFKAQNCLFDEYLHVREDYMDQHIPR